MSRSCTNCGAEVPEGAGFCDNCGMSVPEEEPHQGAPPHEGAPARQPPAPPASPPTPETSLDESSARRQRPLAGMSDRQAPPASLAPEPSPSPPTSPAAQRPPASASPRQDGGSRTGLIVLGGGLLLALFGIWNAWFLAPNFWGGTLEVPTLEGGTLEQARQAVGEDFKIIGDGDPHAVIQSQKPEPGERAERGSEISVVLGADKVATVPDVVGRVQEEAEKMLRSEGFEVEVEIRKSPEDLVGNVLEQSPSAGEAEAGVVVRIVVGQVPQPPEEAPPPEG